MRLPLFIIYILSFFPILSLSHFSLLSLVRSRRYKSTTTTSQTYSEDQFDEEGSTLYNTKADSLIRSASPVCIINSINETVVAYASMRSKLELSIIGVDIINKISDNIYLITTGLASDSRKTNKFAQEYIVNATHAYDVIPRGRVIADAIG